MEVVLDKATKRFGRETVLKDLDHVFPMGARTAVLGPNGSGKSTLLQIVAGAMTLTRGRVTHRLDGRPVPIEKVYRHVSIAAPYLGLYEDLTLRETIDLHVRMKPLRAGVRAADLAGIAHLEDARDKPVRHFSSGMKQRLKLALAILSDTSLLLLDEPATNLDTAGIAWWHGLLEEHLGDRTLLVASNRQAEETGTCDTQLDMGGERR
ncbi:MAG: ATP-binding cassette domain-containing protein [Flavobacteriales bacterium]|nr:ATP-binding cassette domain-containing protein [Flavobacteriales bacterium]MCB9194520.1 ATP-binding cassette domain-containing protein [Flavobacteriales bacterium]